MPLYEYFCKPCNGVFEELRPIREASEPVPCPECYQDAGRIMPTSFAAFTFREGYARRIPDDGKYWHLGHKVTRPSTGGVPNEHPEVNKPEPKKKRTKAEREAVREMKSVAAKGELMDAYGAHIGPQEVSKKVREGTSLHKGTPVQGVPNR